jgi:guanylate kinase
MRTWDKHLRSGGLLVVVSGPSGVGKDSVLAEFNKIYPEARKCVTATTRQPRQGEIDGVDYHFTTVQDFEQRMAEGGFLEYARVHGNLYGTPRSWVEEQTQSGCDVILKIDVQGGIAVKQQEPSCVMIFLVPPSLEELERRLRSRSTETEEEVKKRFSDARKELEQIPQYDYIIENGSIQTAAEQLRAVLIAEHCRIQ